MGIGHPCTVSPKLQGTHIKLSQCTVESPFPKLATKLLYYLLTSIGGSGLTAHQKLCPEILCFHLHITAFLSPWVTGTRVMKLVSFVFLSSKACTGVWYLFLECGLYRLRALAETSILTFCYMCTLTKTKWLGCFMNLKASILLKLPNLNKLARVGLFRSTRDYSGRWEML